MPGVLDLGLHPEFALGVEVHVDVELELEIAPPRIAQL
jgi:hypothetical protein